jgi:methylthioribose-1-phosphate isomerase
MEVIYWDGQQLFLLDQTKLPHQTTYTACSSYQDVVEAIYSLKVRGAPAIGLAAAYGYALAAYNYEDGMGMSLEQFLERAGRELLDARPTAVNLRWAVEQMRAVYIKLKGKSLDLVRSGLLDRARQIHKLELELEEKMAVYGASLIPEEANIITYCNTAALSPSTFTAASANSTVPAGAYGATFTSPPRIWAISSKIGGSGFLVTAKAEAYKLWVCTIP